MNLKLLLEMKQLIFLAGFVLMTNGLFAQNYLQYQSNLDALQSSIEAISDVELDENDEDLAGEQKLTRQLAMGRLALEKMSDGVTLITFMQELLLLQSEVDRLYDIWSDEDIRNGFDKVSDVLTIAGPVVGASIAAMDGVDTEAKSYAIGGGVAVAGIAQLLSKLFGKETAKKYQFIDASRQAYDYFKVLDIKLEEFISSNSDLDTTINETLERFIFIQDAYNVSKEDTLRAPAGEILFEVIGLLDTYQITLSHVPQYISELRGVLETFPLDFLEEEVKITEALKQRTETISDRYLKDVKPLLSLSPKIVSGLYGF